MPSTCFQCLRRADIICCSMISALRPATLHNERSQLTDSALTAPLSPAENLFKHEASSAREDFGMDSMAFAAALTCMCITFICASSVLGLAIIAATSKVRLAKPRQTADVVDAAPHGEATDVTADLRAKRVSLNAKSSLDNVVSSVLASLIHSTVASLTSAFRIASGMELSNRIGMLLATVCTLL